VKFSVNVHMLFAEVPLLGRFELAARAGFGAVESWWPGGESLAAYDDAVRAAGVELVLLNFDGGDPAAGDRGLLSDPERSEAFRRNVPIALELAASLGCRRLNALVGLRQPGQTRERQLRLAVENVRWAADRARAYGAEVLIEPLNRFDNGPYLLPCVADAVAFIERVARENVRLQFDVYHAQRGEGNLAASLRRHAALLGHVQIADSPLCGWPGSGEINFPYVMRVLERTGYTGYVGLEYLPWGPSEAALRWLPADRRSGEHPAEECFPIKGRPVDHFLYDSTHA
jgi:hydroxypyruvate isomerase